MTTQPEEQKQETTFKEWCLVELFGHNKIVGEVSEATLGGGAFLRVDVPAFNGSPAFTRFYNPKAVYSLNPVSEEVARGLMERYRAEPVQRYEMPMLADREPEEPENEIV